MKLNNDVEKLMEAYQINVNPDDKTLIKENLQEIASKFEELVKMLHDFVSTQGASDNMTTGQRLTVQKARHLLNQLATIRTNYFM